MAEFNDIIHQPVRLQIVSALVSLQSGEKADFAYLKKLLKLTDGNLGAHLSKLEEAGYVKIEKTFIARKPRTFINIKGRGRDAFDEHIITLKKIIGGKESRKHNTGEDSK